MGAGTAELTKGPQLPEQVTRRGIDEAQWRTLSNNLFPGANPNSVLMVVDYCRARKLDPLKKPCHIVPIRVKNAASGQYETRDVVMPGIYEYRTTAQRTGEYLGHSKPQYGPVSTLAGVEAPEWCEMTMFRWNAVAGQRVEFPVMVFFREVVATKQDGKANERWSKAPVQMLTKCTEAAGLREAFPDEFGGEPTFEEMDGQRTSAAGEVIDAKPQPVKPEGFDDALAKLRGVALSGEAALTAALAEWSEPMRDFLIKHNTQAWETLKNTAIDAEVVE